MSNVKSMSAVILSSKTAEDKLRETPVDALKENPRSKESVEVIEHLVENWQEVCIAARFIGDGDAAFEEAYAKIENYVSFLQSKTASVGNMLDADFYRSRVNDNFRNTPEGMERSFIVRLTPPKASKSEGFAI